MNISIISLIQSNIYSLLLFTGSNNYHIDQCQFSRSFAISFLNPKSILLENSAFVHTLNTIIYNDREVVCEKIDDKISNCYISDLKGSLVNKHGLTNFNVEFTSIFNSTLSGNLVYLGFYSDFTLKFYECCFYNVQSDSPMIKTDGRFQLEHCSIFNSTKNSYLLEFNTESKTEQSALIPEIKNTNISYNTGTNTNSALLFNFWLKKTNEEIRVQKSLICYNHGGYDLINYQRFGMSAIKGDVFVNNSCKYVLFYYNEKWGIETNAIEESTFLQNYQIDLLDPILLFHFTYSPYSVKNCILDQSLPTKQSGWSYISNEVNVHYDNEDEMIAFWHLPHLDFDVNTPIPSENFECVIPAEFPWPTPTASPTQSPFPTPTASQTPYPSTPLPTFTPMATVTQSPAASTPPPTPSISPEPTPMATETPTATHDQEYDQTIRTAITAGSSIIALLAIIIIILGICIAKRARVSCCRRRDHLDSLSPSVNLIQSNPSLCENSVQGLSSNDSDIFTSNPHNNKFDYSLII